jgi:hypothetical protein
MVMDVLRVEDVLRVAREELEVIALAMRSQIRSTSRAGYARGFTMPRAPLRARADSQPAGTSTGSTPAASAAGPRPASSKEISPLATASSARYASLSSASPPKATRS